MAGSMAGVLLRGTPKRPKVPEFVPIDIDAILQQALSGATQVQGAETTSLLKTMERLAPGYMGLLKKSGSVIKDELAGRLPTDVENYLERKAAEKGVTLGTSGSEFQKFDALRNLGLTSYDVTQKALNSFTQWSQNALSHTPEFQFRNLFPTELAADQWNKSNQWNVQWLRNQLKAIPFPSAGTEALATLFDNIEEIGQSVLSSYAGGMMGGGGGAGGGGGTGGTGGMFGTGRG